MNHAHNWFAAPDAPLLAVELQYYRLPRDDWELMLARMRQMGANAISTYVMWGWHEPQEGSFDFSGASHPGRDLVGFVGLVQDMGLRLLLKPGPFIDAEVLGGGIPSWLLARHPEIAALRYDGLPWRHSDSDQPRCSYLHPTYLEYVRRWYAAVSEATLRFQWPAGPIIALQVDNETPGDGLLAGDVEEPGFDYHFRGDYNPYVVERLWPRWLAERHRDVEALSRAYGRAFGRFEAVPFPGTWIDPTSPGELRAWLDSARFTDWVYNEGLRTYAEMLRRQGWAVPTFQDLLAMPWEASGLLVDMAGFAAACDWLGHNVYAENVRDPFVAYGWYRLSFEEYVHYAFWRTRLVKSYSPDFPAFIPEITAAGDFYFQAPFVGGLEAVCIYVGVQSPSEPAEVGAFARWAMEAPVRPDGSVRRRFWNAKTILTLLSAGGRDLVQSAQPADVALGYTHIPEAAAQWSFAHDAPDNDNGRLARVADWVRGSNSAERSQRIAQALVRDGVDFGVLDADSATPEQLRRYRLLILPACSMLARTAQRRLADFMGDGGQIVWADGDLPTHDEALQPCTLLAQAAGETGRLWQVPSLDVGWPALIAGAELRARYAWAEGSDVDVTVRYGADGLALLALANRRAETFAGAVHYVDADGQEQSLMVRAGGPHVSFFVVRAGRLESALLYGEAGASAVSPQGGVQIERGQVVVAQFGAATLVSAPESTRVTLRRPEGWEGVRAWRLLLDGPIVPAGASVEGETLVLEYRAEEGVWETEAYLLAPADTLVVPELRPLLTTRLIQRALYLEHPFLAEACARVADSPMQALAPDITRAVAALQSVATQLRDTIQVPLSIEGYRKAFESAADGLAGPSRALIHALRQVRAALAAGELPPEGCDVERALTRALDLLARAELRAA